MNMKRSGFLLGAVSGLAVVARTDTIFSQALAQTALPGLPGSSDRVLVVINFAGGNDGLNTVVPFGMPEYYRYRPSLGIAPNDVLRIDATFGLNPVLAPFKKMYDTGNVAIVHGVGYPDPATFHAACRELADFHDELWRRTGLGPEQTVFGGFSMGSVMSYALGLGADRPAPAGILAFSGFIPTVSGWSPYVAGRTGLRAFIAHGRRDPVIVVEFARRARELLEAGGLEVEYHESEASHQIDPAHIPPATDWLARALAPAATATGH